MKLSALTTCCMDHYPQIAQSLPGGNSLNVAAMWKYLDKQAEISVIMCLGEDEHGNRILDLLESTGIDTSRVCRKAGRTASNQLRVDKDGERFGIEGKWDGGVYETFVLTEEDWAWVALQDLVAMPANNPNFPEMLQRKRKEQMLTVDYLDIENGISMADTVMLTDIAFIAAGNDSLEVYKDLAFETGKLVVLTLGSQGSYAFHEGNTFYQAALPVDKVVDTTGCGDAYQAAFSLSYLRYRDIRKAMREGAEAASIIIRNWGGTIKQA